MTDEQNSVTPEWLGKVSGSMEHACQQEGWFGDCPACALNKAAEALREAQQKVARLREINAELFNLIDLKNEENRRLREALDKLVYFDRGEWYVGMHGDACVTDIVDGLLEEDK